eukprot:13649773-Ditylum_brightwellii.AAC.1
MKQFYRCKDKKIKKEKESTEKHNFAYDAAFDPPSGVCACLPWKKVSKRMISHSLMPLTSESKRDKKRQKIN